MLHVTDILLSGRLYSRRAAASESFRFYLTLSFPPTLSPMATVLKAQKAQAAKADVKGKRKADDMDVDETAGEPKKRLKNKQRVLLLSSRGITHRMRHFMNDIEALLPHVKKGASRSLVQVSTVLTTLSQMLNWIPKTTYTFSPNLPTSTTAITPCILRLVSMKISTCGQRRRRMDRVSNSMSRTCTRWTS